MVGRDDIPVIMTSDYDETRKATTYCVRKERNKPNIQINEETIENGIDSGYGDYMTLVDTFVQGIIERAKQEYLRSCANEGVEPRFWEEGEHDRVHAGNPL